MKQPGPDHPITIEPNPHRVRVIVGGVIVAETTRALTLKEAQLPPVQYIPRQDAQMDLFERTEHKSHCPYKGDAAYYTLTAGGIVARNAVWTYEQPYPAVAEIAGHLAFYPEQGRRHRGAERVATCHSGFSPAARSLRVCAAMRVSMSPRVTFRRAVLCSVSTRHRMQSFRPTLLVET